MSRPLHLTSADNPRVKAAARLLREQRIRRQTGLFVAEGLRLIERALAAGLSLRELFVCADLPHNATEQPDAWRRIDAAAARYLVTPAVMRKLAYRQNPEAALAVFEQPHNTLPGWPPTDPAARVEATAPPAPLRPSSFPSPLYLVAVGVAKPGNLGAMARTASAAGASGLLVADGAVDAFNPNALHASTGALLALPVAAGSSDQMIAWLRARGVTLLAAAPRAARSYSDCDLTGPTAIIIGAEDRGLDDAWLAAARDRGQCVAIPMADGAVDSLNAASAAAILLFEAVRQRRLARRQPRGSPA